VQSGQKGNELKVLDKEGVVVKEIRTIKKSQTHYIRTIEKIPCGHFRNLRWPDPTQHRLQGIKLEILLKDFPLRRESHWGTTLI
jgi:hypothetical protein